MEDGDELVAVRGFEQADLRESFCQAVSPLFKTNVFIADKDMHETVRDEAKDLMKFILDKNSEYEGRSVSLNSSQMPSEPRLTPSPAGIYLALRDRRIRCWQGH